MENKLTQAVLPLSVAVAKTKGVSLPTAPVKMEEAAIRFLIDMVASEMTEYVLAKTPAERVDAILDALIYITASAIRHGIYALDVALSRDHGVQADVVSNSVLTYRGMLTLCSKSTVEEQIAHLNLMCARIAYFAEDELLPYLDEVSRANSSKITEQGTVVLNEQGKILKPAGFVPPNLEEIWSARHLLRKPIIGGLYV